MGAFVCGSQTSKTILVSLVQNALVTYRRSFTFFMFYTRIVLAVEFQYNLWDYFRADILNNSYKREFVLMTRKLGIVYSFLKQTFMNHFKRTLQLKTEEQYLSTLNKTFGEICINISSYEHNTKLNSSDTQTPFNIFPLLSKSSVNTISHWIQKQL